MTTTRSLGGISAYKCERSTEGLCQCRCGGKFHGARRKRVPRDDPHAAAFYCPCCGSFAPLHHRSELRFDSPEVARKVASRSTRGGTLGKLSPARCPIKKNWLSCLVSNFSSCFWKKYGECHELPTRCRARACRLVFDRAPPSPYGSIWRHPTLVTDSALGMEDSACIRFRTGLRRIVEQMARHSREG